MAHCYLCGRKIEGSRHVRRRVKTGEWLRKRYPRVSLSQIQMRYGMRIVCEWCSRQMDRREWRRLLIGHVTVLTAFLIGVLAVVLWLWQ